MAAVLHRAGTALAIEEVRLAAPGPGQVGIRLAASGVCHSDLSLQTGTLPQAVPAVLGHEGAGMVSAVGAGVTGLERGDHVIISWISPCRRCLWCLGGQTELCEHAYDAMAAAPYGSCDHGPLRAALGTGTFAEETVVSAPAAIPIDPTVPLELAALVGCGVTTGVGAVLNSARVAPGATVAVVGCGGVGLAAVQGARLAGARQIIAVDLVAAKLAQVADHGATDTVDASASDPVAAVRELTGGRGVDHAFEVVGLSATIQQAYAMARRGGTITVVGAGALDDVVAIPAMQLMVDAKTVRGCVYGSTDPRRDFPRLLDLWRAGRLDLERLISRRIGLDDVNDAFAAMVAGEVVRSVIVF